MKRLQTTSQRPTKHFWPLVGVVWFQISSMFWKGESQRIQKHFLDSLLTFRIFGLRDPRLSFVFVFLILFDRRGKAKEFQNMSINFMTTKMMKRKHTPQNRIFILGQRCISFSLASWLTYSQILEAFPPWTFLRFAVPTEEKSMESWMLLLRFVPW